MCECTTTHNHLRRSVSAALWCGGMTLCFVTSTRVFLKGLGKTSMAVQLFRLVVLGFFRLLAYVFRVSCPNLPL